MNAVRMVCSRCASENVVRNTWTAWATERQEWVTEELEDFCGDCNRSTRIEEQRIEEQT